jgi:hypothetical protein
MNAIMSRKLRGKQDLDKSLHNFTLAPLCCFNRTRKKHGKSRAAVTTGGCRASLGLDGRGGRPYTTLDGAEPRRHTALYGAGFSWAANCWVCSSENCS